MSSVTRICLTATLFVVFLTATQATRTRSSNICSLRCVKRIYKTYCGGAVCIYGHRNEAERKALCSETCINALGSEEMQTCLEKGVYGDHDFKALDLNLVHEVEDYCSAFEHPGEAEGPVETDDGAFEPYLSEDPVEVISAFEDDDADGPVAPVDPFEQSDVEGPVAPIGALEDDVVASPVAPVDALDLFDAEGPVAPVGAFKPDDAASPVVPVGALEDDVAEGPVAPVDPLEHYDADDLTEFDYDLAA